MIRIARTFVLSIVAFAGCTDLETTSSGVQESHAWGGYHWARTGNPFSLKVGDNVSSAWDAYLDTTVGDWSQSNVLDLVEVRGAAKGRCRGTTGRVEVCNASYGNNGWLGVASISVTGGVHITKGTVKLNDTYMITPTYNTPEWRNFVMCQEVGHTLGLDHQDEDFDNPPLGTCMDYTSDPTPNQHPNAHDYEELELIYAHLDTTTSVGQTTADSPAEEGNWGQLVSSSRGGHLETYVADHGNGQLTVRFVIWAD